MKNLVAQSLRGVALAAVITGGSLAPAAAEPVELIYNIFIPPQAGITRHGLMPWAEEVEAASNGTLKLTIPTASLAPVPKLWDAVEDGLIDIALVVNAFKANRIALPTILTIPLVDGGAEAVSRAWWETYEAHFRDVDEYGPFLPLAGFTTNGPHIMATKKHINMPEDLAGLKIRVEGAEQLELFERMGATPIGQPGLNSFELLTGGVVDAGLSPFGSAMVQGQVGVTNEITTFPGGFSRAGFTLVMLRERFDSLPPEAQEAILSTTGVELSARLGAIVDEEEVTGRKAFEDDNANITEAGPELIELVRDRGGFITEKWVNMANEKGLNGQEVLDFYLSRVNAGE